jgi:hypothetical protein
MSTIRDTDDPPYRPDAASFMSGPEYATKAPAAPGLGSICPQQLANGHQRRVPDGRRLALGQLKEVGDFACIATVSSSLSSDIAVRWPACYSASEHDGG